MHPTSEAYPPALAARTRRWATKVDVLSGAEQVATLRAVESGTVELDDVAVRRSVDLTVVDRDGSITPVTANDLLAPRGTEIRPWRGLYTAPETIEWVPLGVFGITKPVIDVVDGATVIRLAGMDRVDALRRRRFTSPWRVARGTLTYEAIAAIVTSRMDVPVRVTATGHTTPEVVYDELSDPWEAISELAEADSLAAYFDALGAFVIAPRAPRVTGATYARGPGSLLVTSARSMDADDTYTGVIVRGEHPDHPNVRAELWDTNPASPTYYLGRLGMRPYGFTSPLLTTQAQAAAAAATILPRVTRMRQVVELTTVGHPGHEIDDLVAVADSATRTAGDYVVRGAKIPLRPRDGRISLTLQEAAGD